MHHARQDSTYHSLCYTTSWYTSLGLVTRNCSQHYFSHASSVIYTHTHTIKEVMHTNPNYMRCNERNLNFMLYDFYDLPRNRTTIRPYCVGTKKGTSWVPFHDNLSMTVDHNATGNGFIQTAIHARLSLTTLKPLTVTEHFTQIIFFPPASQERDVAQR